MLSKTTPGLAAEVRRSQLLTTARDRLERYANHPISDVSITGRTAIFTTSRTLDTSDGPRTYTYVLAYLPESDSWYATGTTTPDNVSTAEVIDWLIDRDVDPDTLTRWSPQPDADEEKRPAQAKASAFLHDGGVFERRGTSLAEPEGEGDVIERELEPEPENG